MNREHRADSFGPKIWIVAPVPPPFGGMSVQAEKLRQKLIGEGLHVELLPTNPAPPRSLAMLARVPGVRTVLREIQYLASLGKIVRNPGVVHHLSASYLFFFLHSVPLLLLAKMFCIKFILNYRGGALPEFLQSWSWLVLPLIQNAGEVAVPSDFLRQVFRRYSLDATLLPNLADTDRFLFRQRNPLRPHFFVSRSLEPRYDVECVLRAFRLIQQKIPDAVLGVAGGGSEESRLRGLTKEWNLRGVEFYGAVPWTELPSLSERFDIYLNASRVDNFPGALVEAACGGLAIVTTRAGGIPTMIRDRENGLLVEIGDDQALAVAALQLLDDADLALRLTCNARAWAEEFSWRKVFPKLLRCYGVTECHTTPIPPEHLLARES